MYRATWSRFDELTLNAPYPSCQEKSFPCSPIHFDEFAFSRRTALDNASFGGRCNKMCTWFWVKECATVSPLRGFILSHSAPHRFRGGLRSFVPYGTGIEDHAARLSGRERKLFFERGRSVV